MNTVLKIEKLRVEFRSKEMGQPSKVAVKDLSLAVTAGQVFGFLGPNGAGKTTTMNVLLGFISATSGDAFLFGTNVREPIARQRIGYLPELTYYYKFLNVEELLRLYARIFNIAKAETDRRIDAVLKLVELDHARKRLIKTYSKGMQQRVGLAQALINNPELLILDEPTSGLDPVGRMKAREIIQRLKNEGKTVFFSSHELGEVETVCDRVAILHEGDARRLFADQFFVKADAYFHSGMYPSIYDNRQSFKTPHIAEDSGAMKSKNTGDETAFLGQPRNWIDAFGRQFFPSVHTHLSEGGASGQEGEAAVREILPWLALSTELDPKRVEVYTVTAYWLRRMNKIDESEQELREGLKENPGDPQLLFDLGRLFSEARSNSVSARNVWEAGLSNWEGLPDKDSDKNKFVAEKILGALAHMEETAQNTNQAITLLERLKGVSTTPQDVQAWIDRLKGQKGP